jgi:hypothetical protein
LGIGGMEMERLTERLDGDGLCYGKVDCEDNCTYCDRFLKVLDKLADYEDAEEQGLLHRTKVAIGQTVYINMAVSGWYLRCKDRPYKAKVVFIGLNDSEEMGGGFFNVAYEKGHMMQFDFSIIGKWIFLTREEAEQALAEMQKG